MPSNWSIFQALCRIVGGQDRNSLATCIDQQSLPRVISMAAAQDVLPTLAFRCFEQPQLADTIGATERQYLQGALLENTRRNMRVVAQCIKLTRALNNAGIRPLLLKGSAQLLTLNSARLGFRKQLDIDLLVAPAALAAAADTLLSQGYRYRAPARADGRQPAAIDDTQAAIRISAAHHHLPALVKPDQIAVVELHRHFLPKRFQQGNPLESLFNTACEHSAHGATFLVPSTEYQLIHIILGKFIHDGFLARRAFPVREALDYITLLDNAHNSFDSDTVATHCGRAFAIFTQLVSELMAYTPAPATGQRTRVNQRLRIMQTRLNSAAVARLLDTLARAQHLSHSLWHNPDKLSHYLSR